MYRTNFRSPPARLSRVETHQRIKQLASARYAAKKFNGETWDAQEVSGFIAKQTRLMWMAATSAQLPSLASILELAFAEAWVHTVGRENSARILETILPQQCHDFEAEEDEEIGPALRPN